jgi:hypothetical protein
MATSEVDICNDALITCGAERITSLSDTGRAARLCNEQYSRARDQLLVSHPWNFAMTKVELTELSALPSGYENLNDIFAYAFTKPTDCLRVWGIDDEYTDWEVQGNYIFANYTPLNVTYIKKVTTTTSFSAMFDKVLALELALKIGYALTQSATFMAQIKALRDEAIREARSFDAQEMSAQTIDADDFINSRF